MDHLFLDMRATAGDSCTARVQDIALIRTDEGGAIQCAYQNTTLDGNPPFRLMVQGISDTVLKTALAAKFIVVVANLDMRTTLRAETSRLHLPELCKGRAWMDLTQVAWPLAHARLIPDRKLTTLARYYGITPEHGNDCPANAITLMRVYGQMMKRYRTALTAEGVINDTAGETFRSLRDMVGF